MPDRNPSPAPEQYDPESNEAVRAPRLGISLDWWSVIIAVALAALLRFGILPAVPWEPPPKAKAPATQPANSAANSKPAPAAPADSKPTAPNR